MKSNWNFSQKNEDGLLPVNRSSGYLRVGMEADPYATASHIQSKSLSDERSEEFWFAPCKVRSFLALRNSSSDEQTIFNLSTPSPITHSTIDEMAPRQYFLKVSLSIDIEVWVERTLGESFLPDIETKMFFPLIKFTTHFPGLFQNHPQSPISPAEDSFQKRGFHIMTLYLGWKAPRKIILFPSQFRKLLHWEPLKRSMWFGNKGSNGYIKV